MQDLNDVAVGDSHTGAHNAERHLLNSMNDVLFPATPPTDGQLLAYSTTLGKYVPAAPGQGELASAVNQSGTPVALNVQAYGGTVYTQLTGMSVTVPPSSGRPVTIEFDALFSQPTPGSGDLWLQCAGGSTSLISIHHLPMDTGDTANAADYYDTVHAVFRIGVVTTSTTFLISAMAYYANVANTPAVNFMPLSTSPALLRAIAG